MKKGLTYFLFISTFILYSLPGFSHSFQSPRPLPKLLGEFKAWTAYILKEKGETLCYALTSPIQSTGKYTHRGTISLSVFHLKDKNDQLNVVTFNSGYAYKKNWPVTVSVGKGKSFRFMTVGEEAWTDDKTDRALIATMKKGDKLEIKGVSGRGTPTIDTYSLSGFAAAYQAISKACHVQPV